MDVVLSILAPLAGFALGLLLVLRLATGRSGGDPRSVEPSGLPLGLGWTEETSRSGALAFSRLQSVNEELLRQAPVANLAGDA